MTTKPRRTKKKNLLLRATTGVGVGAVVVGCGSSASLGSSFDTYDGGEQDAATDAPTSDVSTSDVSTSDVADAGFRDVEVGVVFVDAGMRVFDADPRDSDEGTRGYV